MRGRTGRRWALTVAVATALTAVGAVSLLTSAAGALRVGAGLRAVVAAASKPYTATVSYDETNHGHASGQTTVGIIGHGTFSAKLGKHAAFEVAVIAAVTGVPLTKIAQGGSYVVKRAIEGSGNSKGTVVVRFKAKGLGTLCATYTEKYGKYVPGSSFVPQSGTFTTVGGTGPAARWRIGLSFTQTSVSGTSTEQFGAGGSEHASVGKAKAMTAACKQVAALAKH